MKKYLYSLIIVFFTIIIYGITVHSSEPIHHNNEQHVPSGNKYEIKEIQGIVDDCCCDAKTVDKYNNDNIHYILDQLTTQIDFFKYFKVDLNNECPFWAEQKICSIKEGKIGCGLCLCEEHEVPSKFLERDRMEKLDKVNKDVGSKLEQWQDKQRDMWIHADNNDDLVYLDLTKNPERYTGYEGYKPQRIWMAIYQENCFHPTNDKEGLCFEERVFYRLLSGLHGSITAHICEQYFKDGQWQPNVELYAKNLGSWPERIKNIYFSYLFMIRAVKKAQDQILRYDYGTGNKTQEIYGDLLLKNLVKEPLDCTPFDETKMFSNPNSYKIREEFKKKFQNISQLMDCITCESCKVHAKLQFMGLATALKILTCKDVNKLDLQRNEIISLINTLYRFSESITIHHIMKIRMTTDAFDVHHNNHSINLNKNSNLEILSQNKETMLFLSGILISLFIIIYSFFIIKSKNPTTKAKTTTKTNKTKQKNK